MRTKQILAAAAASAAIATFAAAVPTVSNVTMEQSTSSRLVTITYNVDDEAVITLDIQTNATANVDTGWASIGGEAIGNAVGDVWKNVSSGSHTITWRPDHSWPDHKVADGCARAVVTAWALDNTPDYMVVDLAAANTVRYYPAVDFLPGTVPGQTGTITNNPAYKTSKLVMRKIMAAGVEWTMGSADGELGRVAKSEKAFPVTLGGNYYIGVFEVTQAQWKNVLPTTDRAAKFIKEGEMRPMENVNYSDIDSNFLVSLNNKTGLDFALPSEAQWEFAARAGYGSGYWNNGTPIIGETTDENLKFLGRYKGSLPDSEAGDKDYTLAPDEGGTAIVGTYLPSDWGLYDMHGNVWEWCRDFYVEDISGHGGAVNIAPNDSSKPLFGSNAITRVKRGGRYGNTANYCRSAQRQSEKQSNQNEQNGFRVVCTAGLQ